MHGEGKGSKILKNKRKERKKRKNMTEWKEE